MKKIALLHYAYPPNIGGVELLLQEQAHILKDLGYNVVVLTGDGEENDLDITLHKLPELQSILNTNPRLQEKIIDKGIIDEEFYQTADQIRKTLEIHLQDVNVVIVHNMLTVYRNLPFIYAFREYLTTQPGKKVIGWVHDHMYIGMDRVRTDEVVKTELERELLTTPLTNVEYVVISDTFKKQLLKVMPIPEKKLRVIPDGMNIKKFLELDKEIWKVINEYNLLKAFPLILSPVNILERKNIEYSLSIVKELKKHHPDILYLISGQTSSHRQTLQYFDKIKKMIRDFELDKNVLFLGKDFTRSLEDSEVHDLYQIADLIFYFSKSENFGLPILEAALSKTPIFVSDLRVFHEVGDKYINYIDYKTVSPDKAADKIKNFIGNNSLLNLNYQARTNYNLEVIIREKLVPLL